MPWNDLTAAFSPVKPAEITPVPRIGGGGGNAALTGAGRGDRLTTPPAETPNFSPRLFKTADEALAAGRSGEELAAAVPATREVGRRPRISRTGIRNFASDFGAGIASAPAGASAISSFGHGLFGAIRNDDNRTQAERTAALDAEKRAIEAEDRQREILKGEREEARAQSAEERAIAEDKRAQQELDAKIAAGYFDKDNKALVTEDGELTDAGRKYVIDKAAEEAKSLRQFYDEAAGISSKTAANIDAEIAAKVSKYRQDVITAITAGKDPDEVPTPTAEATTEAIEAPPAEKPAPKNSTPIPEGGLPRLKKPGPAPGGEAVPPPAAAPAAPAAPETPPTTSVAPPEAVEYLKANPALAPQFDEKYGPGSAATVLGR